jgi:hypothetical protein
MNMRKFAATEFIRLDNLQDGPREETIVGIVEGKFDKPDVIFESGAKIGLNKTNTLTLCKAYGDEEQAWIGKVVELFAGTIRYQGSDKEAVLVRPISPPIKKVVLEEAKTPAVFDDEIPF